MSFGPGVSSSYLFMGLRSVWGPPGPSRDACCLEPWASTTRAPGFLLPVPWGVGTDYGWGSVVLCGAFGVRLLGLVSE